MIHVLCLCATLLVQSSAPLSPPALPSEPARRALLVGIENYPQENRWPKLAGPTHDVAALRAVLMERAGFKAENVRTLLDAEATADAIRQGFAAMIDASGPGDLLLFYFAGHGSRVPDDSGTLEERDRWDETLVPFDAAAGPGPSKDIRDEEIGALIERANQKTDQVVLIFDCCSSGTNTRAESQPGRRFLEPARRGFDAPRLSAHAPAPTTGSGYVPPALKYVALAACRADQSAYEMLIDAPDAPGGKISRGVFSYHLVDALRTLPIGASYTDLMIRVAGRVCRSQEEQTPILEGSLSGYVLFERVAAAHTPRFPIEVGTSGALVLAGGRFHGLAVGDTFSVCGEEALRDTLPARLGRVRLTRVGMRRSAAEWLDSDDAHPSETGATRAAFLLERSSANVAMRIAIDPDAPSELVRALESKAIVRSVASDGAALSLRRVGPSWQTFAADETELPLSADASSETQVAALVEDLGRLAAAARIDQLLRQVGQSPLAVQCTLRRVGPKNELQDAIMPGDEGRIRLEPDVPWTFEVRNLSERTLYVHLVTISPDGEIQVPAAPTLDDAVYPDQVVVLPVLRIEKVAEEYAAFYRTAPIRLHCIATQEPLDLASIEQAAVTLGKAARGVKKAASPEDDALPGEAWFGTRIELWVR